jgi:phage terminase large subunit GpA-like protein
MDETDKWPDAAGKEVDPIALAEMRTNAYPHTKKILYLSTPTDDTGIISQVMEKEADEIRRYHVPCPICGEFQLMIFDQIVWPKDVREPRRLLRERLARYACRTCCL